MADDIQPLVPQAPSPPPDVITTREGGDTSTGTSRTPYPGELDAINRAEGAGIAQTGYQEQADALQNKADQSAQPGLEDEAKRKEMEAQVAQNDLQTLQQHAQAAQIAKAQADEQLGGANPQFHNLLQNETGAKGILKSVGLLFTGLSGNVEAQKAQFQSIDNQIKNDFNVQRENYNAKLQYARLKGEDVNDLYSQYEKYQGLSHAAEQKANEAVLAKLTAEAKRNGVPIQQALQSAAAQGLLRNIEQSKANSLGAFTRSSQVTRQLTPTVTDTSGKPIKGAKTTPPIATLDADDVNALLSGKAKTNGTTYSNLTRELTKKPGLGQTVSGFMGGGGGELGGTPNYKVGENDADQVNHDIIGRVIRPAVTLQTQGKRPPKPEDYQLALDSLIPHEGEPREATARKLENLKRLASQPGVLQGTGVAAPKEAPEPTFLTKPSIPTGAVKGTKGGVKGYQLNGKFVPLQ